MRLRDQMGQEPETEACRRLRWTFPAFGVLAVLAVVGPARADLDEINRWAYEWNRAFGEAVVGPGVEKYRRHVPDVVQTWIGNVYGNLTEPVTATSYAIEANVGGAVESSTRFVVNSTIGILGSFDVAKDIGLLKRERSFSEAVCRSGLPLGAFVVLPVIGPTTAGVAVSAVALMMGSTYALSFVSTELAVTSIATDVIGTAAALENTVKNAGTEPPSFEDQRRGFLDDLAASCDDGDR